MNPQNFQLPEDIKQALSHGFVFLITQNLVQHFPAREWSDEQIIKELYSRYHEKGVFKEWNQYRIVELSGRDDLLIIVP